MLTSVTSPILLLLLPQLVLNNIFLLPNEFTEKLSHPPLPLSLIGQQILFHFYELFTFLVQPQSCFIVHSKFFTRNKYFWDQFEFELLNLTSQSSSIYRYWVALQFQSTLLSNIRFCINCLLMKSYLVKLSYFQTFPLEFSRNWINIAYISNRISGTCTHTKWVALKILINPLCTCKLFQWFQWIATFYTKPS